MRSVNKYSSFGGPDGIRAVSGLYVDCEKDPSESIYIHMYIGARVEEQLSAARDRIIALRGAGARARQSSTNGRGHAINKPRN